MTKDTSSAKEPEYALILSHFEESIDKAVVMDSKSWLKQTFTAAVSKEARNYLWETPKAIFTTFPRDVCQRYGITRLYPDETRGKYKGMYGLRWHNGKTTYVVTWDGFKIDSSTKLFLRKTINHFKWLQSTEG